MVKYVYNRVLSVLQDKPFKLLGMYLLCTLLIVLAASLGVLPIISIPITMLLQMGMAMIFLAKYRGKEFKSEDLFVFFKDFWRCAAGMGWMALWIFIWGLIPVVGPIFAVIKVYSYRFTPYILAEDKEVSPTEAIRRSMKMTEGYKGKMFAADLLVAAAYFVCSLVFGLLVRIPYIGVLFAIIGALVIMVLCIAAPLVCGLLSASFYDEICTGADAAKYASYDAQRKAEKELKAQVKAQMEQQMMEQIRQQQAAAAQQAAAQQAAAQAAAQQAAQQDADKQ